MFDFVSLFVELCPNIYIMYSTIFKQEQAHDDSIWCCAWRKGQHDGIDHIITGGVDDMVKSWKWDEEKLELRHALEGHALGVVSVDVNDEGSIAASSSLDSHIRLWDIHTGQQLKSIDAGPVDAWTVTFSPDTKYIATGSHAGKINLFSCDTGKLESFLETKKFTLSIAFSPDGKYLASGAIDGIIKVFDISAGKLVHTLEGHAMPIRSLTFSKDSTMLITASDDCHIKIYNVQHANLIGTVSGHGAWVLSVDCCPDNAHFVSRKGLFLDKTVKVWEIASRECIHTFNEHSDQVWGAKYNNGGSRIVSVSDDRSINIYECPV
ncbi:WD repeat-containing protein 61 [Caerostris extrusa]|uniref:WD repeat-containing protein 61 n=1 Tax=Caerostris extrusa TaxID=172846 RepID=A0AAV4X4T7_CAEEX|nr:WD repeat-containing protein 61 [Caerostris extrusa]